MNRDRIKDISMIAVFAALAYIAFRFFKIDFNVGGGMVAIHTANAFVALAALFLGKYQGALAGAIGLSLADLTSSYAMYAPSTFVLKFMIALITGLLAHDLFKIKEIENKKKFTLAVIFSVTGGIGFNVIASPLLNFFYNKYLLGLASDPASILAKMSAGISLLNGAVSILLASTIYLAAYKSLARIGRKG